MATIDEKLKALREKYTQPQDQITFDEVEKELRKNLAKAAIAELPEIVAVVKDALKRVKDINYLLAYDLELNAPSEEAARKRFALFRVREVFEFWIARFGSIDELEKANGELEKVLDEGLKKISTP